MLMAAAAADDGCEPALLFCIPLARRWGHRRGLADVLTSQLCRKVACAHVQILLLRRVRQGNKVVACRVSLEGLVE